MLQEFCQSRGLNQTDEQANIMKDLRRKEKNKVGVRLRVLKQTLSACSSVALKMPHKNNRIYLVDASLNTGISQIISHMQRWVCVY